MEENFVLAHFWWSLAYEDRNAPNFLYCFKELGCVTIKNEPRTKKTSIFATEQM